MTAGREEEALTASGGRPGLRHVRGNTMTEIYTYEHAVEEAGRENITTVAATYGAATFKAAIRIVDVNKLLDE